MQCISNPDQTVDAEIINNLRTTGINKRKAEEQLFKRFSYFIRIGSNKYSLCNDDLIDAYSDTILAVIYSISREVFENRSSLKTYVFRIYNNKCIDLVRKGSARKNTVCRTASLDDMQGHLSDNSISIIDKLTKQSDLERIKEKMCTLCESCQQLLLLSADGFTDKEISEMGKFKTAEVVKTSRLRCLRKLRQLVL